MLTNTFQPDQILSMTELQKLSLRRLKKMKLAARPLLVMGKKPERRAFVVLDYETYRQLCQGPIDQKKTTEATWLPTLRDFDFAQRGLFWDALQLTNHRFIKILKDPDDPQHDWAISRFLERLTSQEVLHLCTVAMLGRLLARAQVRPLIRKAWEHAIDHWRQTP